MKQMKLILLILLTFGLSGVAAAQVALYGIDVPGNLFIIDVSTGTGTSVGTLPNGPWGNPALPGYNEVEYDNLTGRAWAQQRNGSFQIQEFNITNAAGIGAPIPNGASWHAMEFVNGTLYAAGFAGITGSPSLAILNPATGTSNIIGPLGTLAPLTGIAFNPVAGTMYGIDGGQNVVATSSLYVVNLSTGAAASVGPTGIVAGALSYGPDGNLYAGGVGPNQGNLYRIDATTGANTLVGATGFGTGNENGISGLTLLGTATPEGLVIPTLSMTGTVLLALLLLGLSIILLRRRAT